ncbi:hypothetical protein NVV94_20405 [Pseudomonas sp. LS1212]|uniref:hypothetical protein n=1 Tax=Pseudomonas sp. LS1212 TaxID=2972478 RepID=UPI00215C0055|nr:hypothetical protein [Pseudomonas sp. LS1212]UVJ42927.1 hypothetical protein NVV94_20405 [Pseudomonas sp. LS1212]
MPTEMELRIVAALLRRGRALDLLSQALMLSALAFGLAQLLMSAIFPFYLALVAVVVLLGLWQLYWALRVGLDAELFERMAADAVHLAERTEALDQALARLQLQPAARAGRPWLERQQGALRLLWYQVGLVCAQVLVLLAGILVFPWL